MIVVKIWGGLGNQLFQYAFGYMMAKKHDDCLFLDTSFFRKHQYKYVGYRSFELEKLQCPIQLTEGLPVMIRGLETFLINRIIQRDRGMLAISLGKTCFVKEEKCKYMNMIPYKEGKLNYYDGYWQSPDYYETIKNELKTLYKVSIPVPEVVGEFENTIRNTNNSVSIHIRKGDFNGIIGHAVDDGYYVRAIQEIEKRIKNPVFFVFSDDLQWVKDNIHFKSKAVYADYRCKNGALFDMLCMNQCKHGILSASTFSWWGNWLGEKDIVIAPSGYYYNDHFLDRKWLVI